MRDTVSKLEKTGAAVDILPVDRSGHIADLSALDTLADVATCMWANNETGAIQPIEEIATRANATGTPVHVDAVQAVGKVPINFSDLGITSLAASAHKFGGPAASVCFWPSAVLRPSRSPTAAAKSRYSPRHRGRRGRFRSSCGVGGISLRNHCPG